MGVQSRHLLTSAVVWLELNLKSMEADGASVDLTGPSSGRSKDSVTLEIATERELVVATIWDSGEFEVIVESTADLSGPAIEVGMLFDDAQVQTLLDQMRAKLEAGSPRDGGADSA
ncbi:hypothetical protein [Agromyces mangrovi Wang et al. 2018]|uniref:hypothetical protein n=1 Tax=Agromyces mangrovi TaxID=1858653 RepID=UPI0025739EE7|nr:hypothetical protein [Agromyces mangrovi]BDZ63550.1 hypothetical protein GCM10025877_04880 [Agromyces mangrovi]